MEHWMFYVHKNGGLDVMIIKKIIVFLCGFPLVCFVLLLIYACFLANDVFLISYSSASRGHPYTLSFCLGNKKKQKKKKTQKGRFTKDAKEIQILPWNLKVCWHIFKKINELWILSYIHIINCILMFRYRVNEEIAWK